MKQKKNIFFFLEGEIPTLINMVAILMSVKLVTPDLLKTKVFWNKGYDVIILVHDVAKTFL